MCTAIAANTAQGSVYFGRTMDFSYPLDPELYIVPRGYQWNNALNTHQILNPYSFIGIGQDISPVVFADGVNEMGFAAAVLYFPGYASYDPVETASSSAISIAAIEMVHFLLGQCVSVDQAAAILPTVRIVGVKDPVTGTVAPLHWIIADKSGKCMTVEKTKDGLHLMNNPIGVLSNSPAFPWHMANLRNYMNVRTAQSSSETWETVTLSPFGQGGGTFGLPGDFTPPSRFVRASFMKSHTSLPDDEQGAAISCFHILENVSIPKGVVITDRGAVDYTQYTAFINLSEKKYFFKTYDNPQVATASLPSGTHAGFKIVSQGKINRPSMFEKFSLK